ncbi:MAG: OsmC family protein [Caldiserica bacterium]|nr:OsmC family protein [Caldisericota bacterium]
MAMATFKAISRKLPGGLAVESESHGFKVIMDEPPSMGGTDTGMSPVEALLVSLGSCQVVTAAAFAKSQGIDLKEFWVEVEGDLDPAGFMKGDPNVRPGYQEIRFKMHVKTDAAQGKVEAFQKFIESRCPVGDSLGKGVCLKAATIVIEKQ